MKTIKEFNEFTWDMVRGLPITYHHHINNIPFTFECKRGLKDLYSFVENIVEVDKFNDTNPRETYNSTRPSFTLNNWTPPPLKEWYSNKFESDREIIVINNKYTMEWGRPPCNYFSVEFLHELFTMLKDSYKIVYIRPLTNHDSYFYDDNEILRTEEFDDYGFIKKFHPYVTTINDKVFMGNSYNETQFMLEASSNKHITVSGGNACVASYFGGDVVIYDSHKAPNNRGIWKDNSWLTLLSDTNIHGFNYYTDIINFINKNWL